MAERETALEERQRHDKEIADANRARQIRQGVVPADDQEPEESGKSQSEKSK